MENFWASSVWGSLNLVLVLLIALVIANVLKKLFPVLQKALIPTSVLGGILLLIFASLYKAIFGVKLFNTEFFNFNGYAVLEMITYHALAIGFIASSLKSTEKKLNKTRQAEIFNTGVTTVATYLMQATIGFGITILACRFITNFFPASGVILAFGFGQGTGQAMNYGNIYEGLGFIGGRAFGLTIAALGFLSASIGGVIYLNIMKRKNKNFKVFESNRQIQGHYINEDSIRSGGLDKMSIQIALIGISYFLAYLCMYGLGFVIPGMKSTIFGFNFLLGVISATLVKSVLNLFKKKGWTKVEITDNYLLTRTSNFAFDVMVVAGIAAIQLDLLENYWGIIIILAIVGLVLTYVYNLFIAKTLFPHYKNEQFLAMYGMLTGTASTGIILLREIDADFSSPVSDNLIYQNFPAIVFGFPLMLLATLAPQKPYLTLVILAVFFVVMNVILFRSKIFRRKNKSSIATNE